MKYVLIEVVDGNIRRPEFFDSLEAAHYRMCELVAETAGVPIGDVLDAYGSDSKLGRVDAATYIGTFNSWCGAKGCSDWTIFIVDKDELR